MPHLAAFMVFRQEQWCEQFCCRPRAAACARSTRFPGTLGLRRAADAHPHRDIATAATAQTRLRQQAGLIPTGSGSRPSTSSASAVSRSATRPARRRRSSSPAPTSTAASQLTAPSRPRARRPQTLEGPRCVAPCAPHTAAPAKRRARSSAQCEGLASPGVRARRDGVHTQAPDDANDADCARAVPERGQRIT